MKDNDTLILENHYVTKIAKLIKENIGTSGGQAFDKLVYDILDNKEPSVDVIADKTNLPPNIEREILLKINDYNRTENDALIIKKRKIIDNADVELLTLEEFKEFLQPYIQKYLSHVELYNEDPGLWMYWYEIAYKLYQDDPDYWKDMITSLEGDPSNVDTLDAVGLAKYVYNL